MTVRKDPWIHLREFDRGFDDASRRKPVSRPTRQYLLGYEDALRTVLEQAKRDWDTFQDAYGDGDGGPD